MEKVTNIFKKYLISTNFHDVSMTSLIYANPRLSQQIRTTFTLPTSAFFIFRKKCACLQNPPQDRATKEKYDFIRHTKRQVNTRYEIVVFISSYSEHSNHKSSFCNKKFTNQKQIDA